MTAPPPHYNVKYAGLTWVIETYKHFNRNKLELQWVFRALAVTLACL